MKEKRNKKISPGNEKKFSCVCYGGCAIIDIAKGSDQDSLGPCKKRTPGEVAALRGSFLCLLALAVTVKPLANIVANYARSDRHKETDQNLQEVHPLPVASMGKGSTDSITHALTKSNKNRRQSAERVALLAEGAGRNKPNKKPPRSTERGLDKFNMCGYTEK